MEIGLRFSNLWKEETRVKNELRASAYSSGSGYLRASLLIRSKWLEFIEDIHSESIL